jgi:protein arginine N-methyltransferase 5
MASAQEPSLSPQMTSSSPMDEFTPIFYVGHHETKRPLPITDFVLRQAQDVGVCASSRNTEKMLIFHSMIC